MLAWAEEVHAYLTAISPVSSADLMIDQGAGGTGFKLRRKIHWPLGPLCELKMIDAGWAEGFAVTWTAGRIANRKPLGFNTRGLIDPLQVLDDDEYHHFFAKCTYNKTTQLWTQAEITEEDEDVENTDTVAYYILGWAIVEDGVLQLSPPMCGPVLPRVCDLKNTYAV